MVQMPTGAGKTRFAASVISSALDQDKRVVLTVPRRVLVDQTVASLASDGIRDVGVIQADHPLTDHSQPVQVASVQTLARRGRPEADVVLVDEAHLNYAVLRKWMDDEPNVVFIGLSATPWSRGLGKYYDRLIAPTNIRELIDAGFLTKFRVFAPSHPDLRGVGTAATEYGTDYATGALSRVMRTPILVADVVQTWLLRGGGRPTLCFAVDCVHAKTLQQEFTAAGVACGYMDAHTSQEDRDALAAAFADGSLSVIVNVGVLTTGVDWDVRCIILARPTKSEILYVQIVGRGLRPAEGKDDLLVLDHSDTTLRLGFVTDIHHDALDDGEPRGRSSTAPKEALPRECPNCTFLRPPKEPHCPACGHVAQVVSTVKTKRGELVDLTAARLARCKPHDPDKLLPSEADGPGERLQFLRECLRWAADYGKPTSYAHVMFRQRYGAFPLQPHLLQADPADEVTTPVRNWIVSRNIAYAKGGRRG